jgi:hypothetical protein
MTLVEDIQLCLEYINKIIIIIIIIIIINSANVEIQWSQGKN